MNPNNLDLKYLKIIEIKRNNMFMALKIKMKY